MMKIESLSWTEIKNLAKSRGLQIYGKKKSELIAELKESYETGVKDLAEEVPAEFVEEKPQAGIVFKSMDGRQLEVSINKSIWKGLTIIIEPELADDVRRLLTDGGFIFTEVSNK